MAWVKSEYAGELAVLLTWLVAVAPWSVTLFGGAEFTGVIFRFLPLRLQYLLGVSIPNELTFLWSWEVAGIQQGNTALAGHLGFAALILFALPFVLSLYYYFEEGRITDILPIDPVRLFGGVLGIVGLLTVGATALLNMSGGFVGTTIPVGSVLAVIFAYLLLTVDRT